MASDQPGENTRAVHLPPAPVPAQQPLGTPVYRTAAFAFAPRNEYGASHDVRPSGEIIYNPTADVRQRGRRAEGQGPASITRQRHRAPTAPSLPPGWLRQHGVLDLYRGGRA
jgi:O-acetylhomoserine/O-acetylserine sulfhydrylase-like pyridoxal-dependent enzyme